jgi:hypothetical protein
MTNGDGIVLRLLAGLGIGLVIGLLYTLLWGQP